MATPDYIRSLTHKVKFIVTAAARAAITQIALAMRAVRTSFRASHNARPIIDVTYCVRCGEVIADGDLCDTCAVVVARENDLNHVRQAQRRMMTETGAETPGRAWEALFALRLASK